MNGRTELKPTPQRACAQDERGAILVIALFFAVFLVALLFSVVGTGRAIFMREHLQDSVDGAVLSGAILNAQAMNLIVLANVVMAALLAILVALKAIEGLCIIAIAVCSAVAWITGGATLGAIPSLNTVRSTTRDLHEEVKTPIFTAIKALHNVSDTLKEITPALAKAGAEARLLSEGQYPADKGLVFGSATKLPVEDDAYQVLCERAGEAVCSVVLKPFAPVFNASPALGSVKSAVKSACGSFVGSLSSWFCDDKASGSESHPISRKQKMLYPRMAKTQNCESKGDAADCQWVLDAAPDEAGFCQQGADCEAYEAFVAEARKQCNPDSPKEPERYAYQLYQSRVVYTWNGRAWVRGKPEKGTYTKVSMEKKPPCVPKSYLSVTKSVNAYVVAVGYQTTVHPNGDKDRVSPVCSNEEPPSVVPGLKLNEKSKPIPFKEVTQILGCEKTESFSVPVTKGEDESKGSKDDRNPKRIIQDTKLGDERFLLRAIASRSAKDTAVSKIVDLARWGKKNDSTGFTRMKWLTKYSYAEAEYFYDGSDSANWMWNMNWKARLRRFSAPMEVKDTAAMVGICVGAIDGDCVNLSAEFFVTDLAAH